MSRQPSKKPVRGPAPTAKDAASWRWMRWIAAAVVALGAFWIGGSRLTSRAEPSSATHYDYEVIQTYPHDRSAYTQGLVFLDGVLYEGTGLEGQSTLRKVKLETGEVMQQQMLAPEYFGEGIAVLGDKIYQLTWRTGVGFVYDRSTFALQKTFQYSGEGWGLTHDGRQLIRSDGTSLLRWMDPVTLTDVRSVYVQDSGTAVRQLNELEWVRGEIWANIYTTNRIARIDPSTGSVTGWVHLPGLLKPDDLAQRVDVLNGIAFDAVGNRIFVTGKWWPKLFEIKLTATRR